MILIFFIGHFVMDMEDWMETYRKNMWNTVSHQTIFALNRDNKLILRNGFINLATINLTAHCYLLTAQACCWARNCQSYFIIFCIGTDVSLADYLVL
jgi:hypothetical protein